MYLDSNEITKLNAIISNSLLNNKNYIFSNNAINILLKEANHTIKVLGHKRFIDPGIIQYVLVIGTILRKANENEAKIVAKSYFDLIKRIIKNEDEIGAIAKIRFYTFMCLNLLNTYPSVIENKGSLLWADEKDKIDDFLKNEQKQIDFKLTEFEEKFDIEMRTLNTAYIISEDIQFYVNALIEKLKGNSTTKDSIIKNALFYLMNKNDLVNDDLGVFGLVDDYYALEKAYSKVNVSNLSTDLLKEFLVYEDDSLYTVFEKGKYLETLNPQIQFILASFNYLIKSSSDNIIFVVPSSNIIVLLIIIQFFIKNNYNESEGNKELQKGDDLYFLLPKNAIQGIYDGTFEHDKNKGVIKNDKGEFITLDKFSIRMAARSPQGRTKIISDITKIATTWSNLKRNFIPPHVSIKKNLKIKLFYLTKKKFFDENIKELRPYGIEYRDLINYIYFKESEDIRQIEEQILSKEFLFNVMSDPGKLYSIVLLLLKKEHPVTILSDESELIDEFLSYISDYDLELRKKNLNIYSFINKDNQKSIKNSLDRNFQILNVDGLLENIKVKNTSRSQDILSALENKYYHASKVSEKIYIDLQNAVADELLEYIFLIRNQLDRDEGTILKNYLFRFRDYFVDSYLPIEEAKANKLYEETKDVIANFIGRFKEARNFYDFLSKEENKEKIFKINHERQLLIFNKSNNKKKNFILCKNTKEKLKMFTNLKNNNRLNDYIPIIANDLKRDYIVGNLIIPYMPYSNIQTIIQKGVAEKLIFILLKQEKNFIEDKVRNSKRKNNIYNNSTYSLLSRTGSFLKWKDKIIEKDREEAIDNENNIEYDNEEVFNYFLKDNSDFNTNKSATIKASLLVLDDGKKSIFLPMNSDIICADFSNEGNQNKVHFSFHYEKIKELLQGASICLNTSGKSDMLEELASIKNLNNYKSNKNIGTQWKIDLKNFMNSNNIDITQIQSKLKVLGLIRNQETIKNWMNSENLIAPRNRVFDLKILYKLLNPDLNDSFLNKMLTSIDKVYSARRKVSEDIISMLNDRKYNVDLKDFSLNWASASVKFEVFTVLAIKHNIETLSENLYHLKEA